MKLDEIWTKGLADAVNQSIIGIDGDRNDPRPALGEPGQMGGVLKGDVSRAGGKDRESQIGRAPVQGRANRLGRRKSADLGADGTAQDGAPAAFFASRSRIYVSSASLGVGAAGGAGGAAASRRRSALKARTMAKINAATMRNWITVPMKAP